MWLQRRDSRNATHAIRSFGLLKLSVTIFCLIPAVSFSMTGVTGSNPASNSTDATRAASREITNPIVVKGSFQDSASVQLTIDGYALLPAEPGAMAPWYADTVMIWYQANSFPQTTSASPPSVKLPLSAMKQQGTIFSTKLPVPYIGYNYYFFKGSVHWTNKSVYPPLDSIPPFGNDFTGAIVCMGDSSKLDNLLTMTFGYTPPDSQVMVTIGSLKNALLKWNLISGANLRYAITGSSSGTVNLTAYRLGKGDRDTCIVAVKDPNFSGVKKLVYWQLWLTGLYKNRSDTVPGFDSVGAPQPPNTITVKSDSAWYNRVKLSWRRAAGEVVDSIRIWFGLQPVPYGDPSPAQYNSVTVRGSDSTAIVEQLNASTLYHFGLQVQRHKVWSLISDPAKTSGSTVKDTAPKPVNKLKLTANPPNPVFDSLTNKLRFTWTVDTSATNLALLAGIVWKENAAEPFKEPSDLPKVGKKIPFTTNGPTQTNTYDLIVDGTSLQFNKTYHFGIWLSKVDGAAWPQWSLPTPSSQCSFTIPKAVVDSITYFDNCGEVTAFGGKVVLKKAEDWSGIVGAKISLVTLPSPPSGLIPVSEIFTFNQNSAPPTPINFGLRYDSIPPSYALSDIRMYHYDTQQKLWYVDTVPQRDPATRIVSIRIPASNIAHPFMLAIDNLRPVITVQGDTASALHYNTDVPVQAGVSDNIANPEVTLLAGRGDTVCKYVAKILSPSSINHTIPGFYVDGDCGMRILLVVNDGRFVDTVNISRDIRVPNVDGFIPEQEKWVPLRASVMLDIDTIQKELNEYAPPGGAPWVYDKNKFRLYRWFQKTWLEYYDSHQDLFSLIPGRLIWLKTRNTFGINFDSGRTVSLKQPYAISLSAKDWTDFTLPYRFAIYIGDVLSATDPTASAASKELQFYVWTKDPTGQYYLNNFYLPLNQQHNNKQSKLMCLKEENNEKMAYSVYNPTDYDIPLRIPGIPTSLSTVLPERTKRTAGWSIAVRSHTRENETLSPVFCAYRADGGASAAYPLPPSWSKVSVGLCDATGKKVYGNVITGELTNGGYAYQLVFNNDKETATRISYTIERYTGNDVAIKVLDPRSGTAFETDSGLSVDVEAHGRQYRWLAVGSPLYIESLGRELAKGEFAFARLAPNPFRGVLRIGYRVPYAGIAAVRCELIDALGRLVWTATESGNLRPGGNEFVWNSRKSTLAAGAYIVRLTGFDDRWKKKEERLSRVMYVP